RMYEVSSSSAERDMPPLAGRAPELEAIEHHFTDTKRSLLLLAGEPGIGKSRLLHVAALRGRECGWTVLHSGCYRTSGQAPYAPFLAALADHLCSLTPAQRRLRLYGCAWLVQLLPELAQVAPPLVPAWGLPPEQERRLLFAAVARFLANASGPAGTLLVLDDLQWAGADALDLLASLVRGHRDRPLQIIGAYRGTEVPTQHHFAMLLADLAREGLATHVELGPLSGGEAAQLIHSLLEGEL